MNEKFYHWLMQFSKEELLKMMRGMYELDKAWFPYQYCFIADTDDKLTLLMAYQNSAE
jgi:hypothetical protein